MAISTDTQHHIIEGEYTFKCKIAKIGHINSGIDISSTQVTQCIVHESIFLPFMQAEITITDSARMLEHFNFCGNEMIRMSWISSIDEKKCAPVQHDFYICSMSPVVKLKEDQYSYIFQLVSMEYFTNIQSAVSKTFKGDIFKSINEIATTYMNLDPNKIKVINPSKSELSFISNLWDPLYCIQYATRHLVDKNNFPGYMFFEDRACFNIVSIQDIIAGPETNPKITINKLKKVAENTGSTENRANGEMGVAQESTYAVGFNINSRVRSGFYGGVEVAFNSATGVYTEQHVDISSTFKKLNEKLEPNEGDAPKISTNSHFEFIPKAYNNITGSAHNTDDGIRIKRQQMIARLKTTEIRVKVYGTFEYFVGGKLYVEVPVSGMPNEIKKENSYNDAIDKTLSGYYIITAIHHIHDSRYFCILQLNKGSYI